MDLARDVQRLVRSTQRRLWFNRLLAHAALGFAIASGLALLTTLADRFFALNLPLVHLIGGLFALAAALAIVTTIATRERTLEVAELVDQRAHLSERVSSAIALQHVPHDHPWAQAVLADTQQAVRQVRGRQVAPLRAPAALGWLAVGLVVLGGVYRWAPSMDLLGREAARQAALEKQRELEKAKAQAREQLAAVTKRLPDANLLKDVDPLADPDPAVLAKLSSPDAVRQDAIKRLEQVKSKVEALKDQDKFKGLEGLKDMLGQLKPPTNPTGSGSKLSQSLREGDFGKAQQALSEMAESLAREPSQPGQPSEQAKKTAQDLQDLSRKLSELSKREDMQKALKDAGMNQEQVQRALDTLAKQDLEQLAKELEKSGLSQEQVQKLMDEARKQVEGDKKLQELAKKLEEAAKQCQNGQCNNPKPGQQGQQAKAGQQGQQGQQQQAGQQQGQQQGAQGQPGEEGQEASALAEAEQELGDLEAMDQQLADLESAMNEAQGAQQRLAQAGEKCGQCEGCKSGGECTGDPGAGSGEWEAGDPNQRGNGQGGPGIGQGGGRPMEERPYTLTKVKNKTEHSAGVVIKRWMSAGEQIKGEARAEYTTVATAAEQEATDAISKDQIPRQYQNAVRGYFGGLSDAPSGPDPSPAQPTPAPAPAAP